MKIGFIGVGNMGYAMLKGVLSLNDDSIDIVYSDFSQKRCEFVKSETGIDYVKSNQEVVDICDYVVLGVKPQYMKSIVSAFNSDSNKVFISPAPGLTRELISSWIKDKCRMIRIMPNTPALIGEGMTAVSYDETEYNQEEISELKRFFGSFGQFVELPEKLMDAVVPLSGSSPAYIYMMIEAMADGAVLNGIPRQMAYSMAAQTMIGTAKMVLETGQHPGELKDAVCSPGGTTIEAVRTLEEKGFRSAVIEAMDRCYKKSKNL